MYLRSLFEQSLERCDTVTVQECLSVLVVYATLGMNRQQLNMITATTKIGPLQRIIYRATVEGEEVLW